MMSHEFEATGNGFVLREHAHNGLPFLQQDPQTFIADVALSAAIE